MRMRRGSAVKAHPAVDTHRPPAWAAAAGGGVAGGVVMFLVDPDRGRRRRAVARAKAYHYVREAQEDAGVVARDSRHRLRGVAARARRRIRHHPVDDTVLVERVRAELGRVCRHPRSITVQADGGTVTLSGPILADEVDRVMRAVRRVPGVREVHESLEMHEHAGDIPSLQGDGRQPRPREPKPELLQEHWSPAARFASGAAGGAAATYGITRGRLPGAVMAVAGLALLARAATNLRIARLTGVGVGRNALELQKSINIAAPVEQVWELWDGIERFPTFMRNVRRVSRAPDGRSHWEVKGPAGRSVVWDAEVTKRVPNEELAWKTCPGSPVQHAGVVRFEPTGDGGTEVTVRMSYNPAIGGVGRVVANLLGANPHKQLDEDLLRMKTYAETGTPAHDAAATT